MSHRVTLRHTPSHSVSLRHTASHCVTLRLTSSHSVSLRHTASHCVTLRLTPSHSVSLRHTPSHSVTLTQFKQIKQIKHFAYTLLECTSLLPSLDLVQRGRRENNRNILISFSCISKNLGSHPLHLKRSASIVSLLASLDLGAEDLAVQDHAATETRNRP